MANESDANEKEVAAPGRILPVLLALFIPGAGYFALGRWSFAFGLSLVLGALSYVSFLAAASGHSVLCAAALALAMPLFFGSVIHVAFAARNAWSRPPIAAVLFASLVLYVVGYLEGFTYRRTLVEAFNIPSGSMIPTLHVGDHVFIDKRAVTPKRGDVIVFNYMRDPSKQFIKRCIAVGGDTVELHDDVISVNGIALVEKPVSGPCSYEDYDEEQGRWESRSCLAFDETIDGRTFRILHNESPAPMHPTVAPTQIPAGGCWAVGDNRDNSHDSRYIGPVPAENIVGTARFIWWSRGSGRMGLPVR